METGEGVVIDEKAQRVLSYLQLFGPTYAHELLEHISFDNESELEETINELRPDSQRNLVKELSSGQMSLTDQQVTEYSLTEEGRSFVQRYESEIAVPVSVQEYLHRVREIEDELQVLLTRFEDRIGTTDTDEELDESLNEMMDRIEAHFAEIRKMQPNE